MSIEAYPSPNGVLTSLIWRKTAVGGETSLSGYDNASQALSYTPGQEQVYLNGILLVRALDYTATNGTSITGLTALAADDFVQINCYNNFSVASVPAASLTGEVTNSQITSLATSKLTGTVANNQLANSSITINGSAVSLGGSVSLAGDIESVTAGTGISGGGSSGAVTITNSMATAIDAKGDLIVGTGADTFSKLTAGANGTTLVADSSEATGLKWATPALTLISTTTFSAVASQSLNNIFSADYTNYKIFIETGWNILNMRLRVGGVDNTTASSYATTNITLGSTALTNSRITDTSFKIADNVPTLGSVALEVFAPFTTQKTRIMSNVISDAGTSRLYFGYGFHDQTVSYDGITIFPDSSTLTGSISVYGYND